VPRPPCSSSSGAPAPTAAQEGGAQVIAARARGHAVAPTAKEGGAAKGGAASAAAQEGGAQAATARAKGRAATLKKEESLPLLKEEPKPDVLSPKLLPTVLVEVVSAASSSSSLAPGRSRPPPPSP
jgi:hypothetical protein